MKKISALFSVLAITALSAFGTLFSKDSLVANYSPNTGDTAMIIFIILGVVAVGLLIFLSTRKKR